VDLSPTTSLIEGCGDPSVNPFADDDYIGQALDDRSTVDPAVIEDD
jgi:hypothetical protein